MSLEKPSWNYIGVSVVANMMFLLISSNIRCLSSKELSRGLAGRPLSDLKRSLIDHSTGQSKSGPSHIEAVRLNKINTEIENKAMKAISNQMSAVLHLVKTKCASLQYKNTLGLLSATGSEVGTINHSRLIGTYIVIIRYPLCS